MRLFVSIDISEELTEAITNIQREFTEANGLRFTNPETAHITLKFLGEVSNVRLKKVDEVLNRQIERSNVSPFSIKFAGLGAFPSMNYIKVIWLGVTRGTNEITELHETVENGMTEIGFNREQHEFTPHVTLARMEHSGGKEMVQELISDNNPTVGEMKVTHVNLTESKLDNDGPVYSTINSYSLDS